MGLFARRLRGVDVEVSEQAPPLRPSLSTPSNHSLFLNLRPEFRLERSASVDRDFSRQEPSTGSKRTPSTRAILKSRTC